MFRLLLAVLFILFTFSINVGLTEAATLLSGSISSDTTLHASSGPYLADSPIIEAGATLTIESGVVVKFQDGSRMTVHGSLVSEGTLNEPVYFTSIHDDEVGGDTNGNASSTTPSERDWRSITFSVGSSAILDHVVIRYAGYKNRRDKYQPAIYNQGGDLRITNSSLNDNFLYGIGQTEGSLRLENTQVSDNQYGFVMLGGTGVIENNTFSNNSSRSLVAQGDGSLTMRDNSFNDGGPVDIDLGDGMSLSNSGNTANNSTINGLILRGSLTGSLTLSPDDIPYVITSGGGLDASGEIIIQTDGELSVASGGTLNINPGTVLKFAESSELVIDGTVQASGTEEDKVYFTSLKDDTVGGDTNNDGVATTPDDENWKHVQLNSDATALLDHVFVGYAGGDWRYGGSRAGLYNLGGTMTVTNSEVTKNNHYGFLQEGGSTTVNKSIIHDNVVYGVRNVSGSVIDATSNYWGDPTGPHHSTLNPGGQGNQVSDNVTFEPWWENEDPTPPVDPLVLRYAPILYMHEFEDYLPMNVEAFVEASSLFDRSGNQLYDATALTYDQFKSVIDSENTSDYYLAFSDTDNPGSVNLSNAKAVYDQLVDSGKATTTIYYHKMEDGFTDSFGQEHNYIVLQYWFFYAVNNWGEHGGYNDHEGDWESVFVFLDKDTEEPEYVAFSSHLNDGEVDLTDLQYTSVRKRWIYTSRSDSRVDTYVSLGSHANYARAGDYFVPNFSNLPNLIYDHTSATGSNLDIKNMQDMGDATWSFYEGLWGTYTDKNGFDGPRNPQLLNTAGNTRFYEPVKWAGIDKTVSHTFSERIKQLNLSTQRLKLSFDDLLESGAEFAVDLYEETINIGNNVSSLNLLPWQWDINSNLENGEFSANMTFSYDADVVEAFGGQEENVKVFWFNEDTEEWEEQDSVIDTDNNTVTLETTHFSVYALGLVKPEEESDEEVEVVSDETETDVEEDTEEENVSTSGGGGGSYSKPKGQVAGVNTSTSLSELVEQFTKLVERVQEQEYMSDNDKVELTDILTQIVVVIESLEFDEEAFI